MGLITWEEIQNREKRWWFPDNIIRLCLIELSDFEYINYLNIRVTRIICIFTLTSIVVIILSGRLRIKI